MNKIKNNTIETSKTLGLLIAALLTSPLVISADEDWYAGASVGQTNANLRFNSANLAVLPTGVSLIDLNYDDTDTGFKLFGGRQFSTLFALEGGYFDLGKYTFNTQTNPVGTSEGHFDVDGWYLDMVGTMPLTSKFDFIARAGFNYATTTTEIGGTGAVPNNISSARKRDSNPKLGVGLQYAMTNNLDLRLEVERYHLDEPIRHKGNVDLISLGAVYRFGYKAASRNTVNPVTAAPVAKVKPSVTNPAPGRPAPVSVVFSVATLFDFDQSVIKDAGKLEIDRFIADLDSVNFDTITVTGHTDRIGTRSYNLGLSQRRSDAVKNYLVQTGNLPASKINSNGVNGDDALVRPDECGSYQSKADQILCLQPDRRVLVEVEVTKE